MSDDALQAKLLTVGELFGDSDATYTVPIYQRNYAWGVEQVEQLLRDVRDALADDDDTYFLGNLVVTAHASVRPDVSDVDYEVVDGQQRLTTLYLLLTFLASSGTTEAFADRLRYQSRRRSSDALRRISSRRPENAEGGAASAALPGEDLAIHDGYNVIAQFMEQRLRGEARERFAAYLRDRVTVVRAVLPSGTDLNRYFEVMNTRGQQLQQVDIVKARLMSRLDDAAEQACFAWVWDACADMDSYVQMALARGDTVLRRRLFGRDWASLHVGSFDDLQRAFGSRRDESPLGGRPTAEGSMTLDEALRKYAASDPERSVDDADNVRFRSTIEFPAFLLHVLKVWRRDSDVDEGELDDKRLVDRFVRDFDGPDRPSAASGGEAGSGADVRDFLVTLLRCRTIFDTYVLKRQFTAANLDEGDWSLQRLVRGRPQDGRTTSARYIDTASSAAVLSEDDGPADPATRDLLLLQSMLRVTYTSPRTMHWITLVLRTMHDDDASATSVRDLHDALRHYARDRVRAVLGPTGEPPAGFDIPRVVFTYLDYLLVPEDDRDRFRFTYRNSIEHFYPQSPDPEESGAVVGPDHVDLLGNLALVSVGANSKFSNSLPNAKAWNFQQTIELQSPKLKLMAEITRLHGWNDVSVQKHHDAMVALLRKDLGLPPFEST